MYLEQETQEYEQRFGMKPHTAIMICDRGTGDTWNADFQAHMRDTCAKHKMQLISHSLPGGHNKFRYDQHGNVVGSDIKSGMSGGHIMNKKGESPAMAICGWLNEKRDMSLKGNIKRRYHPVPAAKVPPRTSAYQPLKAGKVGITSVHCIRVDPNGNIFFKYLSCFNNECFDKNFCTDCGESDNFGKWMKVNKIKKKSEVKKRQKFVYNKDDPVVKQLFDGDPNKWKKPDLIKLCKSNNVEYKGVIKFDLILGLVNKKKRAIILSDSNPKSIKKRKRNVMIPESLKCLSIWNKCNKLDDVNKRRIIDILTKDATKGDSNKEEILLNKEMNNGVVTKRIFRWDWTTNKHKIINQKIRTP
eukprot:507823_1